MSLSDAAKLAIKVLKQVMEEKLNSTNIQLAKVTEEGFGSPESAITSHAVLQHLNIIHTYNKFTLINNEQQLF